MFSDILRFPFGREITLIHPDALFNVTTPLTNMMEINIHKALDREAEFGSGREVIGTGD